MRRLSSLVVSLALASCAQGPGLVVEVGPLPPNATLLQPYLSLDGKPAKDIQPLDTRAGQSVQTFGLRLPTSVSAGQAAVDVLVLDQSGCALATGAADAAVAPEVRVKITLTALPTPRCDKKRPLLFSVTPPLGPTSGQTTVTVRGLGLLPSTAVKIGGAAAPLVAWRSPLSMTVTLPSHKGIAQVPVTIEDTSGQDQLATGFRYYSPAPDFLSGIARLQVLGQNITVTTFALGNLDANLFPDLVGFTSAPVVAAVVIANSRLSLNGGTLPKVYALPNPALAAVTGPFSDSGFTDIAIAQQGQTQLFVLFNQGDGTYWKDQAQGTVDSSTFSVGGQPVALATADLNGDGKMDLVTANQNQKIGVLLRALQREYTSVQSYPLDLAPRDLAVGDLNGDGRPDLVVVYQGADNGVELLFNQDAGKFPVTGRRQLKASGTTLHKPVIADFDGDGHQDLAFASEAPRQLSVWLNTDGTFQNPARADYPLGGTATGIAVGDLDGDLLPDLAVLSSEGAVTLALNQRDKPGTMRVYAKSFPVAANSIAIGVTDADQDGAQDIGVIGGGQLYGLINSSP